MSNNMIDEACMREPHAARSFKLYAWYASTYSLRFVSENGSLPLLLAVSVWVFRAFRFGQVL